MSAWIAGLPFWEVPLALAGLLYLGAKLGSCYHRRLAGGDGSATDKGQMLSTALLVLFATVLAFLLGGQTQAPLRHYGADP